MIRRRRRAHLAGFGGAGAGAGAGGSDGFLLRDMDRAARGLGVLRRDGADTFFGGGFLYSNLPSSYHPHHHHPYDDYYHPYDDHHHHPDHSPDGVPHLGPAAGRGGAQAVPLAPARRHGAGPGAAVSRYYLLHQKYFYCILLSVSFNRSHLTFLRLITS